MSPGAAKPLAARSPDRGRAGGETPLGRDVLPPVVDHRYVWIIAMGERSVTRIDQRSVEMADVPAVAAGALAVGAGSLWLGDESGEVWRIDPETLKVAARIDVDGRLRGLGFGGGLGG